jgi:polyhydroxyalkanoate synthesis regulator phasin
VQAFREALESSRGALGSNLTLSRERIQEVLDDAVERGRITRGDANEMLSKLVDRGRKATDELMRELERLLDQARSEIEARTTPLAEADKIRRRAGAPGPPITGYDQLTASQVKSRLRDLNKADLRKVRTQEKRGKARKGILDTIDGRLAK